MAARFPQEKQPKFPVHCIGTRKSYLIYLSNLIYWLYIFLVALILLKQFSVTKEVAILMVAANLSQEGGSNVRQNQLTFLIGT